MQRVTGLAVSAIPDDPLLAMLEGPSFDDTGHQRAKRINGHCECPRCGLLWPLVNDIVAWTQREDRRWYGVEWDTGVAFCDVCDVAIFEGFDTDYVVDLRK